MALLDNISKKITTTTQNVARGAKEFTDLARLNSLIAEERRQAAHLHAQIGKLYYESGKYDEETTLGKLCLAVTAANERIEGYNQEMLEIKGAQRCAQCGLDIPLASAFCGNCGAKIEAAQPQSEQPAAATKACTGCGVEIPANAFFCGSCGSKL